MDIKSKLSELPDNEKLSYEYANTTYTVAELKHEILELGEPHHERTNWCIAQDATWSPNAESMLEDYIDREGDDMYEDWDMRATDCVTEEYTERIQVILEEMFASTRSYWIFGKDVEIDIFLEVKTEQEYHENLLDEDEIDDLPF